MIVEKNRQRLTCASGPIHQDDNVGVLGLRLRYIGETVQPHDPDVLPQSRQRQALDQGVAIFIRFQERDDFVIFQLRIVAAGNKIVGRGHAYSIQTIMPEDVTSGLPCDQK